MKAGERSLFAAAFSLFLAAPSFCVVLDWIDEEKESTFLAAALCAVDRSPAVGEARAKLSRAFLERGLLAEGYMPDIGLSLLPSFTTDFPRKEARTAALDLSASLTQALPTGGFFRLAAAVPLQASLIEETPLTACFPRLDFELEQGIYLGDALGLSMYEAKLRKVEIGIKAMGIELLRAENACVLELASYRCLLASLKGKKSAYSAQALFLEAKLRETAKSREGGYLAHSDTLKAELELAKNALELLRTEGALRLLLSRIESMTGLPTDSGNPFALPPALEPGGGKANNIELALLELDARAAEADILLEAGRKALVLSLKVSGSPRYSLALSGGNPLDALAHPFSGRTPWITKVSLGFDFSGLAFHGESLARAKELERIAKDRIAREKAEKTAFEHADLATESAFIAKELRLFEEAMRSERLALDAAEALRGWGGSGDGEVLERKAALAALFSEWAEKEASLRILKLRILDAEGLRLIDRLSGT